MPIRRKIVIKGIVQDCSYLTQTQKMATSHRVKGWVRNLSDGNVEACLEGAETDVGAVLAWCFVGPARAQVEEIRVKNGRYRGRYRDFEIMMEKRVRSA